MEPARQELTTEIRWIRRGRFGDDVDAWFSRFAPVLETREDDYLIAPAMPGLSVKIRGGSSFDVKQYQGAVGALDIPVEAPAASIRGSSSRFRWPGARTRRTLRARRHGGR